jgi:hypothetical protein
LCGQGGFGVEDEGGGFRSLFGILAGHYSSEVRSKRMEFCVAIYLACASTKHLSVAVCSFLVLWYGSLRLGLGGRLLRLGRMGCRCPLLSAGDCVVLSDGVACDGVENVVGIVQGVVL